MKLFTLIHICGSEQSIHNNSFVKNFDAQISLYLNCAKQLHSSLKNAGIELAIITNDKASLQRLNSDHYPIELIQLDFTLKVPSGIKFYSAHFKIEVFQYLSTLTNDYVGLIDADMVCINPVPQAFKNIIEDKLPVYYNITDQISPAYGQDEILKDKRKLSKTNPAGIWAGGEFLTGTPSFFDKVYKEITAFLPGYFSDFNSFNHQGDEMLTSVALENLMVRGEATIIDAGVLGIIGRYWSPKTLHVQKQVDAYMDHFILHLPSDSERVVNFSTFKTPIYLLTCISHIHAMKV